MLKLEAIILLVVIMPNVRVYNPLYCQSALCLARPERSGGGVKLAQDKQKN